MPFDPLDLPLPGREGDEVELVKTLPSRTHKFGAVTRARVRAIDVLFEADARQVGVEELAEQRTVTSTAQTPLPEAAKRFALMYAAHAADIDDTLASHSEAWTLERMPAVDRAILRMGAAEILHGTGVDAPVLLKEYTSVAAELSPEDSASFVNALLQRIADAKDLLG